MRHRFPTLSSSIYDEAKSLKSQRHRWWWLLSFFALVVNWKTLEPARRRITMLSPPHCSYSFLTFRTFFILFVLFHIFRTFSFSAHLMPQTQCLPALSLKLSIHVERERWDPKSAAVRQQRSLSSCFKESVGSERCCRWKARSARHVFSTKSTKSIKIIFF